MLLEDGVFGAITSAPDAEQLQQMINSGTKVFAIEADVKARGLADKLLSAIELIDYSSFVQLSIKHRCIQSWY